MINKDNKSTQTTVMFVRETMMANPNQLKTTNVCAHMHNTVFRERSTLNQNALLGFRSGKEQNRKVLKHVSFLKNSDPLSSEPKTV